MIRAACHCGAVRFSVAPAPAWVMDCNCSLCRRYGALWTYTKLAMPNLATEATLLQGRADLTDYVWGPRQSSAWRCRQCGCATHGTVVGQAETILAINARLFVDFDPASVALVRTDNAHTGWFWTRPDGPVRPGGHAPMPPPGPDDWR